MNKLEIESDKAPNHNINLLFIKAIILSHFRKVNKGNEYDSNFVLTGKEYTNKLEIHPDKQV